VAASYGYLASPEALHPEENQHRLGASVLHSQPLGSGGDWSTALIYGANKHTAESEPSSSFDHSVLLESNVQLDDRNSVFGRAEWVQKKAEELVVPTADPEERFNVASVVLGYVREVAQYGGASLGLGVRGSFNFLPNGLQPTYETRAPAGIAVYARLRPGMLQRAHADDHDQGHRAMGMDMQGQDH
jgi:hypothetical protein